MMFERCEALDQRARAGLRDRAEVLHQLVARHADAGVADRDRLGVLVGRDANRQLGLGVQHLLVGEHLELHAVQRVRGVRDQLAQEDLAVGVERVRQDAQ
jgi:hypothetical protein